MVVDGATPEIAESAAGALASALAKTQGHFQEVAELGAPEFFKREGLLFLSRDELQRLSDQLIRAQPFLGALATDPTLRGLAGALRFIPEGERREAIRLEDFANPLTRLSQTIDTLLAGRTAAFSWSELVTGSTTQARELRRFIRVKPILDFDALQPGAAASDAIRKTVAELGLRAENGVTVRLTGPVAIADEEFGSLADGAALNSVLTVVAVLIILWLALRSGKIIFAVVTSLFAGLAITSALGLAMVGALNLISVAFAVLFVGIGVDFGIQFAVRYRRERHLNNDLDAALASDGGGDGEAAAPGGGGHRRGLLCLSAHGIYRRLRARAHRRNRHDRRLFDERHAAAGAAHRAETAAGACPRSAFIGSRRSIASWVDTGSPFSRSPR